MRYRPTNAPLLVGLLYSTLAIANSRAQQRNTYTVIEGRHSELILYKLLPCQIR